MIVEQGGSRSLGLDDSDWVVVGWRRRKIAAAAGVLRFMVRSSDLLFVNNVLRTLYTEQCACSARDARER